MNERGKSDKPIVPEKPANKEGSAWHSAEQVEGRGLAKGNPDQQNKSRAQYRMVTSKENPKRARSGKPWTQPRGGTYSRSHDLPSALDRIRAAAQRDRITVGATNRDDPRQEPSAVTPLAGIRGGGSR